MVEKVMFLDFATFPYFATVLYAIWYNPSQRQISPRLLVKVVDPFKNNGKQAKSNVCVISLAVRGITPNHSQSFGHESQSIDCSWFINEAITQGKWDFLTSNEIIAFDSRTSLDLSITKRYCVYISGKPRRRMTALLIICWKASTQLSHE
jgi:hypothetical protein